MVLLIACAACHPAPEPSPRPTVSTPQATLSPEPTPRPTVTTPEATVVPEPTPTAALDITVRELVLGEESDILAEVTVNRFEISRDEFNRLNPNCRLLTPEGSLIQSSFALAGKKDRQFYASGNLNLPQYPADSVYSQPYFNQKDSVFVMRWEDASGHQLYHCPLREDQTGRPLAVYQRNNELYEAFVGADGRIEAKSERPFWQAVPSEAKNIALVKFDRAVYLTFWRADGQQIESERIKICALPEPEPTPEPIEAANHFGELILVNKSALIEMRFYNEQSKEQVRQFFEAFWAEKRGISVEQLREQLAKGQTMEPIRYPQPAKPRGIEFVTELVDITKPVNYVLCDQLKGLNLEGSNVKYEVNQGQLTIYVSPSIRFIECYREYPTNTYISSFLLRMMIGIFNNGDTSYDPEYDKHYGFSMLLLSRDASGNFLLTDFEGDKYYIGVIQAVYE